MTRRSANRSWINASLFISLRSACVCLCSGAGGSSGRCAAVVNFQDAFHQLHLHPLQVRLDETLHTCCVSLGKRYPGSGVQPSAVATRSDGKYLRVSGHISCPAAGRPAAASLNDPLSSLPSTQVAQYPSGPAALRHDGQLSEHRQGEGALQGQIRSSQQPAGLPSCAARLDSRGSASILIHV